MINLDKTKTILKEIDNLRSDLESLDTNRDSMDSYQYNLKKQLLKKQISNKSIELRTLFTLV